MYLDEPARRRLRWLRIGLMTAAVALPVLLSLLLARDMALADQGRRAASYAADVRHRSDEIGAQVDAAFARLANLPADADCDQTTRDLLRQIDATSSVLQMVGLVEGDRLVCSSYGAREEAIALGPVDFSYPSGFLLRQNVELPFAPGQTFIVSSNGRVAAVIHKALPLNVMVGERGISLAVVTAGHVSTFAQRGEFDPAWVPTDLAPGQQRTLQIDGSTVSQARSDRYDTIAIAALDASDLQTAFLRYGKVLGPTGLLTGAVLAWLVLRLIRAQAGIAPGIRNALRQDQFFIVLQPIVALADGGWVGAEVLLRWRLPDGRLMRPDLFIPVAEDTGMITDITARVFEKSEPVLAELRRRGSAAFLSINLSPQDLLAEATLARITALLERTGLPPAQLHVEITERGFADTAAAREQVRRLRELGVRVSIDDFGTGYSSLSELVTFELDTLKIDKTFVDTLGGGAVTSHVAFHIVEMARSLSLETIAEGIEQQAQADILRGWGVGLGQGWLYSKPLAPEDFLASLPAPPSPAAAAGVATP